MVQNWDGKWKNEPYSVQFLAFEAFFDIFESAKTFF